MLSLLLAFPETPCREYLWKIPGDRLKIVEIQVNAKKGGSTLKDPYPQHYNFFWKNFFWKSPLSVKTEKLHQGPYNFGEHRLLKICRVEVKFVIFSKHFLAKIKKTFYLGRLPKLVLVKISSLKILN